jgi:general transcription factor IIIA
MASVLVALRAVLINNIAIDRRYTCVHASCLAVQDAAPAYYATWTALQHHIRTTHPPTCLEPACNGKMFKSQRGLRAHMKLHNQNDVQDAIASDSDAESEIDGPPCKKRRGGEVGRDWLCEVEGCGKDFKSVRIHIYSDIFCFA